MKLLSAVVISTLVVHMCSCKPSTVRDEGDKRPEYRTVNLDVRSFKNIDAYRVESKEGKTYIIYNPKCDTTELSSHRGKVELIQIGKWYPLDLKLWDVAPTPVFYGYPRGRGGKAGYYIWDNRFNLETDSIIDGMVTGRISLPVYQSPDLCNGYVLTGGPSRDR